MKLSRRDLVKSSIAGAAIFALPGWAQAFLQDNPGVKIPMAMNLAGVADWEPGYPFLNLMWGAREWITKDVKDGPWNTEALSKLSVDENGYPTELPQTVEGQPNPQTVATILPNRVKGGKYVMLFDGEGEFEGMGRTKIVETAPGRLVLEMSHLGEDANLEGFRIVKSTKDNHVRNIRIVPIEHETTDLAANPFRPELLEFCKPFHALRFMDWQETNGSCAREWKDRRTLTYYTQRGTGGDAVGIWGDPFPAHKWKRSSGVALELCIQLCNLTATDCWLCVPHLATDEFVTEMARLVKAKLDPARKVYVEYSNEVWNWGFQQAQFMLRSKLAGDLLKQAGIPAWKDESAVTYDDTYGFATAGEGDNFPERTAMLFAHAFKLFEAVFSGEDRKRMVRVVASQQAWTDVVRRTTRTIMQHGGADALSVAGYFGPNGKVYDKWEAAGASLTADQVMDDMSEVIESDSKQQIADCSGVAKEFNLDYIIYEGGQHIQPKNQEALPYLPALKEAQKHPRMYDLYKRNFELHQQAGTKLFAVFSSVGRQGTRWGSWGHLEHYGQSPDEMPKFKAVLDCNTSRGS
jgi:hypothetical protein